MGWTKSFLYRFVFLGLALCSCDSLSNAQGPAPAATKNRVQMALMRGAPIGAPPLPGTIQFPINQPIGPDKASILVKAKTFEKCAGKSCSWSATPWPFAGIGLNSSSGILFGTPTGSAQANVEVTATDAKGRSYQAKVLIEVVSTPMTIRTESVLAYPVGQAINEQLQADADGNTPEYVWTRVETPPLPSGVTLDANGKLTGTATTAGTYNFTGAVTDTSVPPKELGKANMQLVINPAPDCGNPKYTSAGPYFHGWFPLSRKTNVDPLGNNPHPNQFPTENDVQCFYSTSGLVSVAGKIQYLYGFGGGANTISADLVSVQMPAPIGAQVSFGSSVTAGGTGTPSSSSTTNQTQPTVTSALQSVEAGGNFYVHVLYPIGQHTGQHLSAYTYLDPKVGFSFNGFAGQATLSQGSEQYFGFPIEIYTSYDGIAHAGGVYFDYRGGLQSVPGSFAKSVGLSQHNFFLNQLSFGFNFVGLFRIGAQRFFGPAAAFNAASTSASSFNKWHLVLQLSPKG